MIEWIRWIVVIGLIVGAYVEGKRQGAQDQVVQYQAQAIAERDGVIAATRAEVDAGKERAAQERVDLAAMQESIEQLTARSGSIGAQLRSALNASNLATCLLNPDVQRVRTDAYEQARSAATAANQAGYRP